MLSDIHSMNVDLYPFKMKSINDSLKQYLYGTFRYPNCLFVPN